MEHGVLPIRTNTQCCIGKGLVLSTVEEGVVFQDRIFLGVEEAQTLGRLLHPEVGSVLKNGGAALLAFFRLNKDDTIGCPNAKDGGCTVLQDVDGGNVIGVEGI